MAFAFDGHRFEKVLGDAEGLLDAALDLERQLVALVTGLDGDGSAPASAASFRMSADFLDTVRRICVDARAHRQAAEALLVRLIGDSASGNGVPRRPRILVVDDSQDNLELVTFVLERSGFEAITAANGLEAVIVAHYAGPDLVLMDLTMPIMDGIEAARLLRSSPATEHLRIVAHTATPNAFVGMPGNMFAGVLAKPVDPAALVAAVRGMVDDGSPSTGESSAG